MDRWEVVTRNDDDELWQIAEQVRERGGLEDGLIRWVIETSSPAEAIQEIVPSLVSLKLVEPDAAA